MAKTEPEDKDNITDQSSNANCGEFAMIKIRYRLKERAHSILCSLHKFCRATTVEI